MGDLNKSRRQDLIFQYLKGRDEENAKSPNEIKARLENDGVFVNLRTVRRDLETLSSTHGLCSTETRPERFYPSKDFDIRYNLQLNEKTLQALLIALNNLKYTSHSYFKGITTEAETAIIDSLDPQLAKELQESKKLYHFDFSTSGKPSGANLIDFEKIMEAIRKNIIFLCAYQSPYKKTPEERRKRRFAPLKFILSSSIPYILVKDVEDNKVKNLRMTRISNVELTGDLFCEKNLRDSISLESFIGGWGAGTNTSIEIAITCDKQMATYFQERIVHSSQKVNALSNGLFEVSLRCAPSKELPRLIASFGGSVKKVSPTALFNEVKEIWSQGLKNAA